MVEPILHLTPNGEALALLASILEEPDDPERGEPIWETSFMLRITRNDLHRFMYGNGNLSSIVLVPTGDGVEGFPTPDPEPPSAVFEEESWTD